MKPEEKGKLGGTITRENHLSVCPLCGAPVKSRFFRSIGQKGGERAAQTAENNGTLSMSERGQLGGRGNTREKRNNNTVKSITIRRGRNITEVRREVPPKEHYSPGNIFGNNG